MLRHFTSPIVGQGQAPLSVDAVEHGSESSSRRSGSCKIHFCQCDEEGASLNQRADGGRIALTLIISPSQWLGMTQSSICGGRIWMLTCSEGCSADPSAPARPGGTNPGLVITFDNLEEMKKQHPGLIPGV